MHPSEPIRHLLNKKPILKDLAVWLVDVEPKWPKLEELLGVSGGKRESLERLHVSDGERLSKVLDMWRGGITSDYTIIRICVSA